MKTLADNIFSEKKSLSLSSTEWVTFYPCILREKLNSLISICEAPSASWISKINFWILILSILSCIAQILGSIFTNQISEFLFNEVAKEQHKFLKGRSTVCHLLL